MFFFNEQHHANYEVIIKKFPSSKKEYLATCYLAAFPEVFKCFELAKQSSGPFDWYFDYLSSPDQFIKRMDRGLTTGTVSPLTHGTESLVHLALNLWNGRPFDLTAGLFSWAPDLYKVALQAIDLRR